MANRRKGRSRVGETTAIMRSIRRRRTIDSGMMRANRAVTIPDAKKEASRKACRGREGIEE